MILDQFLVDGKYEYEDNTKLKILNSFWRKENQTHFMDTMILKSSMMRQVVFNLWKNLKVLGLCMWRRILGILEFWSTIVKVEGGSLWGFSDY